MGATDMDSNRQANIQSLAWVVVAICLAIIALAVAITAVANRPEPRLSPLKPIPWDIGRYDDHRT